MKLKLTLSILTLLFTLSTYSQEKPDLYYVMTVPAFDLSYQEKGKLFLAKIFTCKGYQIDNYKQKVIWMKEFKIHLLKRYDVWKKYSDPLTQANWNCSSFSSKNEAEKYMKEQVGFGQELGDVIYTDFKITNCE
ncbi:MAG: hypothetical protein COA67_05660 [Lutibacter sp.]|nr:MAG: hypothetical protein COA67_05660 [Lutibacter sp.]